MPGTSGLALAGVEAIVEGLQKFESDTERMNKALDGIRPRATLLQRGFESLTTGIADFGKGILSWGVNALSSFAGSIIHIAEIAIGVLLRDAINAAIGWIRDFIGETIEAGSELQLLQLRLNRLNFNELKKSGQEYIDITGKSIEMTKEQLNWLIRLAAQTPYDNADIANVYTLARSYGFASEESKGLTQDIVNFASGMGLTEEHIKRIIINFGQMKQQGKITGTELRDLGRGSFVPVNDILERVAENLGITTEELNKLRKSGKTDAEQFILAFSGMVHEDFEGAAQDMRRALVPAIENIKETFRSLMSWNVVVPIMDLLGGKISDVTDAIVNNETMWNRLTKATEKIGTAIVGVLTDLLGLAPSAESIADTLVGGVERMAEWIEEHREDIVSFFKDKLLPAIQRVFTWVDENGPKLKTFFQEVGETIRDKVIPWIKDELIPFLGRMATWAEENGPGIKDFFLRIGEILRDDVIPWFRDSLIPFFERIATWVGENGPTIKEFFLTIAEIGGTVFKDVMEWLGQKTEGDSILDSITNFMKFVIEKKDKIAEWVEILAKAFIIWQVLTTVWSIAMSIIIPLIGFVLGLVSVFVALNAVVAFLAPVVMALLPWLAGLAAAFIAVMVVVKLFQYIFELTKGAITILIDGIKQNFILLRDTVVRIWNEIVEAGKNGDWAGVAASIVNGLNNYVTQAWELLKETFSRLFQNLIDTVKNVLGIHSPSTIFMGFGQSLMEGIAIGILNGVSTVTGAIEHMGSVALEKINHWSSVIANALTFGFAAGIADTTPVAEAAGRDMVNQTNKTTRKKAKAFSPSKLFEQLGVDVAMGFAQGIERAAGLAAGAMQGAVSAAMVPAFSSMAGAGGNTITNNRTANLTINSSAPVEPIMQDFHMLETLIGA